MARGRQSRVMALSRHATRLSRQQRVSRVDEEALQRSSKRTDVSRAVLHSPSERDSDAVPRSGERNCSVARTVSIVSDAWAFLIIREAFFGARTFEAFRAALDIPRATLTDRLRNLARQGIFRQVAPTRDSRRKEYRLTKAGFDLYSSFVALKQFGDHWLAGRLKAPLTLVHTECGCESH